MLVFLKGFNSFELSIISMPDETCILQVVHYLLSLVNMSCLLLKLEDLLFHSIKSLHLLCNVCQSLCLICLVFNYLFFERLRFAVIYIRADELPLLTKFHKDRINYDNLR